VLYRIAAAVNATYGLAVAWTYIAAFVLALGMIFIFPPGTLLVFFIGLASLGLAVALGKVIDAITRSMARRSMASGRCPRCRDVLALISHGDESPAICALCGSAFTSDGGETIASEQPHFVNQPEDDDRNDESDVVADAHLAGR
jgi:hypothetical protein